MADLEPAAADELRLGSLRRLKGSKHGVRRLAALGVSVPEGLGSGKEGAR
jgi:hypothetical protein